jgi:hypothetical protein
MPLPWVRLDTNLPSHDKILELLAMRDGHRTAFVYVCSLSYCGHNQTDGFIPLAALPLIHGRRADADRLVEVRLWTLAPKGWVIPNWLERQESSQVTESKKSGQRLASLKANCIRWHGPDCGCWKEEATA